MCRLFVEALTFNVTILYQIMILSLRVMVCMCVGVCMGVGVWLGGFVCDLIDLLIKLVISTMYIRLTTPLSKTMSF